MKTIWTSLSFLAFVAMGCSSGETKIAEEKATVPSAASGKNQYMDVHDLTPGGVSFEDVMAAHQKDLAVQDKHGVRFVKFWVDEARGKVYCLSEAKDSLDVIQTHREAHGLLPSVVMQVKEGE